MLSNDVHVCCRMLSSRTCRDHILPDGKMPADMTELQEKCKVGSGHTCAYLFMSQDIETPPHMPRDRWIKRERERERSHRDRTWTTGVALARKGRGSVPHPKRRASKQARGVMFSGHVCVFAGGQRAHLGQFGGTWVSLNPERRLEDRQSRTLWG